jgi:hypothetical protein
MVDTPGNPKVHRKSAARLGLGERVVVLPRGSYIIVRGAVVLAMSPEEVDALPSASNDSPQT